MNHPRTVCVLRQDAAAQGAVPQRHEAHVKRVQLAAVGWAGAGVALVLLIGLLDVEWSTTPLPATGWVAAAA